MNPMPEVNPERAAREAELAERKEAARPTLIAEARERAEALLRPPPEPEPAPAELPGEES